MLDEMKRRVVLGIAGCSQAATTAPRPCVSVSAAQGRRSHPQALVLCSMEQTISALLLQIESITRGRWGCVVACETVDTTRTHENADGPLFPPWF
jgi:hypothetical protein